MFNNLLCRLCLYFLILNLFLFSVVGFLKCGWFNRIFELFGFGDLYKIWYFRVNVQ